MLIGRVPCRTLDIFTFLRLQIMTFHRVSLALILIAGAGFVLASCDSADDSFRPTEVTFEGVTYAAIGQAELDVSDDGLLVGNIGSSGNDGVRVTSDMPIEVADVRTLPVSIPNNGRWGCRCSAKHPVGGRRSLRSGT